MRALPFLLLMAASAVAQPASLDRQIADLDREIARLDRELAQVQADLSDVRADERDLDADREAFQDAIRAFEADRRRYQIEAGRVEAMYDDLLRYGGDARARRVYDDARYALLDEAERLEGEARMLDEWNADLNAGYRDHAGRVRQSAGWGQQLAERRSDLRHERETLEARRARLAVRGR